MQGSDPAVRSAVDVDIELEPVPAEGEVGPAARVHRSRLAFAVSATLAALPLLVVDNFPATADTGERAEIAASVREADVPADDLRARPATTAEASSTSEAVEAEEPSTTEPPTTEPPTTEAPTTTATAPPSSLQAAQPAPATTAPPAPPPTEAPAPEPSGYGDPGDPATWDRLAQCESNGQWHLNSGNGYYGGLQFSLASWQDVGGSGYPHQASREEQIRRGQMLQARYGWGQWPHCSSQLGYR